MKWMSSLLIKHIHQVHKNQ